MEPKELTFELKDVFSQYLWCQADFPNAQERNRRLPDGIYMVNVLYSLNRSVGSKHPVVAALAGELQAQLLTELDAIETELVGIADQLYKELAADILQLPDQCQPQAYRVEAEKLRKLPIKFIRCFVLFDSAMHALTQKSRRGMLSKGAYQKERKALAKSLRRFMAQNNTVVRAYHEKRQELIASVPRPSADLVPGTSVNSNPSGADVQ